LTICTIIQHSKYSRSNISSSDEKHHYHSLSRHLWVLHLLFVEEETPNALLLFSIILLDDVYDFSVTAGVSFGVTNHWCAFML
jgi:hypothetical protein